MTRVGRRPWLLGALAVLVVAGGLGDSLVGSGPGQAPLASVVRASTALAPVSAVSSSWYCAVATKPAAPAASPPASPPTAQPPPASGAGQGSARKAKATSSKSKPAASTGGASGGAQGAVIALANTGPSPVKGTVSVVGQSAVVTVAVSVPAHGKATLDESHLVTGADIAATVVLDGGGVAVEQLLSYGEAVTVTPCSSRASTSWYFASGSTAGADQLLISLYNPFPTSAVVDLSFATDQGAAAPSDYQGIVVPAQAQVVESIGAHVQQRALVATAVNVLDGRVVADEVQLGSTSSASGATVAQGAPAPGRTWDLPAGLVAPGTVDRLDIYNPSSAAASVQISLALSFGSTKPIQRSVPPGSVVEVVANDEPRVPHGELFGVEVSSTNGVGVVAERSFLDKAPQPKQGLTYTVGGVPSRRWVLASGAPAGSSQQIVVVENPGAGPVPVTVTAMSGGAAEPASILSGMMVRPGRPAIMPLSAAQLRLPLVVSAGGPVVVEQDIAGPGGHGVSSVLGEPAG
ncbi:MAG: DUF5719 family protein [Acidimicrobiales bacterium]